MEFLNWIKNELKQQWNSELLGELLDIEIEILEGANLPFNDSKKISLPINLLLANIAAAISTNKLLGSANMFDLKSVKSRMDTSAAHAFANVMNYSKTKDYIAASEAKDEHGEIVVNPLEKISEYNSEHFGIAVDVIDGTTLAAKGLNGAYTLSAAAHGLIIFPDLQAYAVGGPSCILDNFDFYEKPEKMVDNLIASLSDYYNKPPSDLKIVTHSFDTGKHHTTLIEQLKNYGVQVIVPDPVIVEPPYVLGMALREEDAPDFMIGVFGLPEIVINTLLLAVLNKDYELRFRISSNQMLEAPEQTTLDEAFSFNNSELCKISELNLKKDLVYTKNSIALNTVGACFAATALTNDSILKLSGIKSNDSEIKLQTIFSGYDGYTIKLSTIHRCVNMISYISRFPQIVDDLSIVLPIKNNYVISIYNNLVSKFKFLNLDTKLKYTPVGDLHITLYEFGTHYGGYSSKSSLAESIIEARKILAKIETDFKCSIMCIEIKNDSIIMKITIHENSYDILKTLDFPKEQTFFNMKSIPKEFHITVARFEEYLKENEIDCIKSIITEANIEIMNPVDIIAQPTLVHIVGTPYTVGNTWSE